MYTGVQLTTLLNKLKRFDATYDTVAGATDWQKKQMAAANRRVQGAGTSTQSASFKSGNRAIVRDSSGRERIGYKLSRLVLMELRPLLINMEMIQRH